MLKFGDTTVDKLFFRDGVVNKVYHGDDLIYEVSVGGLPAEDGVRRNNIFTAATNGAQTVSASGEEESYPAWKASDGGTFSTQRWNAGGGLPQWWKIDFGSAQVIYSVRVYRHSFRGPKSFTIESSDDDSTWTIRATVVDTPDIDDWQSYPLDTPAEARYWRVVFTASYNVDDIMLREFDWLS